MSDYRPSGAPRARASGRLLRAFAVRSTVLALLWWFIAEGRADAWVVGAPAALAVAAASVRFAPPSGGALRPWPALRLVAWFLVRSLLAGADVALRALRPDLPLAPAFIRVPLRLADPGARVVLADVLSLLPGTLSTAFDGDALLLHVLDERQPTERQVRVLEERLAAVFAVPLADAHGPTALEGA